MEYGIALALPSKEFTMNTPVVLITGALTGIGRATALAFAKEGARIVVSGRRDEAGQNLVAELREIGAEAEYWRADVRHEDDVRSLIDKTVAHLAASILPSTTPRLRGRAVS
jgi:NAD(P)-dependent dehydrogenase (short-subunit alcohol dehydrogenase family)